MPDTTLSLDRYRRPAAMLGFLALFMALAAWKCQVQPVEFFRGIGKGLDLVTLFFPPDWSALKEMLVPVLVTFLIAAAATPVGAAVSVIFGLAGASNVSPSWLRASARFLIALERGMPEIIVALLLVSAFGLGPASGVMALAIGSIGMLGKLMADSIEDIDARVLESVHATGASSWQVIRYAVLPEVLPSLYANSIFRFEVNIRASVLLGAVGAGGIGYELNAAMSRLEYDRATVAVCCSLLLVFLSERLSDFLRHRFFAGGRLK